MQCVLSASKGFPMENPTPLVGRPDWAPLFPAPALLHLFSMAFPWRCVMGVVGPIPSNPSAFGCPEPCNSPHAARCVRECVRDRRDRRM